VRYASPAVSLLCVTYNIHIIRVAVAAKANRSYAVDQRPVHTSEEGSVVIAFVVVIVAAAVWNSVIVGEQYATPPQE